MEGHTTVYEYETLSTGKLLSNMHSVNPEQLNAGTIVRRHYLSQLSTPVAGGRALCYTPDIYSDTRWIAEHPVQKAGYCWKYRF